MPNDPINEAAGLGPEWVPAPERPPIIPGQVAAPPVSATTPVVPQYSAGSLPPNFQHDASFVDTAQPTPNAPKFSLMPLGLSSNSVSSAQITSVVKTSQQLVGNTLTLETDGLKNPNQNLLNITAGANVTIEADASGAVTIAASGGTTSPKIEFKDHFTFGNTTDLTSAYIGELGWSAQDGPTSGLNKSLCMGGFPNLGQVQLFQNSATANSGGAMVPSSVWGSNRSNPGDSNSVMSSRWPLLDFPGWTLTWIFRIVRPNIKFAETNPVSFDVTKLSLYVGLANGSKASLPTQFSQRPNVFYGVRFDTDTTSPSIADTTFHLEACQNALNSSTITRYNNVGTGGGNFDTAITPTENVFYTLTMTYLSANSLLMSFTDGTTTASTTFTLTPLSMAGLNSGGFSLTTAAGLVGLPNGPSSFTNLLGCFGFGTNSKATISGMTGGFAVYNGVQLILDTDEGNAGGMAVYFKDPTGGSTGSPGTFTMSGYSGLVPFVGIANDTTGGGTSGSRSVAVDQFHFTWS